MLPPQRWAEPLHFATVSASFGLSGPASLPSLCVCEFTALPSRLAAPALGFPSAWAATLSLKRPVTCTCLSTRRMGKNHKLLGQPSWVPIPALTPQTLASKLLNLRAASVKWVIYKGLCFVWVVLLTKTMPGKF